MVGLLIMQSTMFMTALKVQECDATKDNNSSVAWDIKNKINEYKIFEV
jgi:hypothetical protein